MDTTQLSEKIQTLDGKGLKELLEQVKLYKNLSHQLGKRGQDQYNRNLKGEKLLVVEHFTQVSEDLAWDLASSVYKKSFSLDIERSDVQFVKKDSLKGGIKIYSDDYMVDLSYANVEAMVTK